MQQNLIDIVKLIGTPETERGWYVVEGPNGRYHVSALGGRAAKGLRPGTQLKLFQNVGKQMSAYVLSRA
jgi:hypothetical protein